MAERPSWTIRNNSVTCEYFDFTWNSGFAASQKKKNVRALHESIRNRYNESALEISTKSDEKLGNDLSAFNLKLDGHLLECVFQSSKKYLNGGPYLDLLDAKPKDAKRDERHKSSGSILGFQYNGYSWPLVPRSAFYDYIYVSAVADAYGKDIDLTEYQWFTDIEFNPDKSINCQARAITIYKLIQKLQCFDVLDDKDAWIDFHKAHVVG